MRTRIEILVNLLLICVLAAGAWIRISLYGDLHLSVAIWDTPSYIESAKTPALTWQGFTSNRLFTTNVIYSLTNAKSCVVTTMSMPGVGKESRRRIQPCFSPLVLFHLLASLFGWGFLILVTASRLETHFGKVLSTFLLTAFAFTPPIADWDSILSSEAINLSLFALSVGLTIIVLHNAGNASSISNARTAATVTLTILSITFWVFVRDINLSVLLIFLSLALPFFVLRKFRNISFLVSAAVLMLVSGIGSISSSQSNRWKIPITNAYHAHILPHPARVQEMHEIGMPDPSSPQFDAWFDKNGLRGYVYFLVTHPGFIMTTTFENINFLFSENSQPYFKANDLKYRNVLLRAGDIFHPESSVVILIGAIFLLVIIISAVKTRNIYISVWAWILTWLFISAAVTLVVSFWGDAGGLQRHILFSLTLFRLLVWLTTILVSDILLSVISNRTAQQALP